MRFPTGLAQFDLMTCGGLPAGVVELAGPDSSGKTALSLSCAREACLAGLPCALIFMQGSAPDTEFVRQAGHPNILVVRPTTGESALEAAHSCLQRGVKLVIIDSIANVRPLHEDQLELGEIEDGASRMLHHGLHALRSVAWRKDALVLLTNEIRAKLSSRRGTISAYERVMQCIPDMRLRVERVHTHLEWGELDHIRSTLQVTHSTIQPPGTACSFRLYGIRGVNRGRELLECLIDRGVFERTGAYWKGLGDVLGPGYEKAAEQVLVRHDHYMEVLREDYRGDDQS